MKIIGVAHIGSQDPGFPADSLILKGDSALLVNRKPFFVPDETDEPVAYPALALRVSRLGKQIAPRFASRYYDGLAPAMDIQAADLRAQAIASGKPWTQAVSLDGSFPLGQWQTRQESTTVTMQTGSQTYQVTEEQIAEAVSLVSRYMTIRQGDIIYLQLTDQPLALKQNDCLTACLNGDEQDSLFCRIK